MAKEGKKEGKKGDKGAEAEQKPDLSKISEEIANVDAKQHIDQIAAGVMDTYHKQARFTDDKGVVRYKEKFTKEEGRQMAESLYDTLSYHLHRRVYGLTEEQFKNLSAYKDPNGNPYVDAVVQYHFPRLHPRKTLQKAFSKEDENKISLKRIMDILSEPMEHHKAAIMRGLLERHGIDDPKHMDALKKAIADIVAANPILKKKKIKPEEMYDPNLVLQTYVDLSKEYKNE
jgi:hypothetical protein